MAAATIADLERRLTPRVVVDLLDDDGDGVADAAVVADVLGEALAITHGILKSGYVDDDVRTVLIEGDPAVKGALLDIAASIAGRRPSALGGAGPGNPGGPYSTWRKEAEAVLERMASAERRIRAEDTATGAARNAHVSAGATRVPAADFVFGGSGGSSRNPGGF